MLVREFIEKIQNSEEISLDLINVKKYISSEDKLNLAKAVIDESVEYDRGFVKFDSYQKHIYFICGFIETHTDLRFADRFTDKMKDYDTLCENGAIDMIIDTLKNDYDASLTILEMTCNDMLADNSIEASVARLSYSISESLDVLSGALADKLETVDIEKIIPKNLDLNKLQKLLNKLK